MSSPSIPPVSDPREFRALAAFVMILGVTALITVRGLVAPLIVGAWFAGLTAPWVARLAGAHGRRRRVAGVATMLLVLLIVAPVVLLAVPLAGIVMDAIDRFTRSPPNGFIRQLIEAAGASTDGAPGGAPGGAGQGSLTRLVSLGRSVAPSAASFLSRTFSAVTTVLVQVFILALSAYYFAAEGPAIMARIRAGSPFAPSHQRRLEREFLDVARAMLVGEMLTAAAQGLVAGVIYYVLRVPHALFFAVLTAFLALMPTLGSALVWVPLCGVLFAAGRTRDAIILAACGVLVIGLVDNVMRPFFTRLGADKVHPLLIFLGIFGGLEVFGGWGLILGPLVLSLFVAAFRLYSDEAANRRAMEAAAPGSVPDVPPNEPGGGGEP